MNISLHHHIKSIIFIQDEIWFWIATNHLMTWQEITKVTKAVLWEKLWNSFGKISLSKPFKPERLNFFLRSFHSISSSLLKLRSNTKSVLARRCFLKPPRQIFNLSVNHLAVDKKCNQRREEDLKFFCCKKQVFVTIKILN